jgi:predicted dehydrogenase
MGFNAELDSICFIGLGGAGQRHARLFRKALPNATFFALQPVKKVPLLDENFNVDGCSTVEKKFNLSYIKTREDLVSLAPDLVVISTPSSLHESDINICLENKINVFCEKPAFISRKGVNTWAKTGLQAESCFFVSYQRRWSEIYSHLRNCLSSGRIGKTLHGYISVKTDFRSWHKYESYRDLYAAKRQLGGGVIRTECHEIYAMIEIFGFSKVISCQPIYDKALSLDVETSAVMEVQFGRVKFDINLDFVSDGAERVVKLVGENGFIELDFDNLKLVEYSKDLGYRYLEDNATNTIMFERQLKHFLNEYDFNDQQYFTNSRLLADLFDQALPQ